MKRLWVDANVVLRHLTGDPPQLAERAGRFMAKVEAGDVTLIVTPLVLAEVFWVLKSFYGIPIAESAPVLLAFVCAKGVEMEERDATIAALELVRDEEVDLADAWLAVRASRAGETVCTFDRADFKKLRARWMEPA